MRIAQRVCWLGLAVGLLLAEACSPGVGPVKPDTDTCDRAPRMLPPGMVIADQIEAPTDPADCKKFKAFSDGKAIIEMMIGNAFARHDLRGTLTLYDVSARILGQKVVDPANSRYVMELPVKKGTTYYVELKVSQGKHSYTTKVTFKHGDPCAACTPNQKCEGGRCVDPPPVVGCDPPCLDEEVCRGNKCMPACSPPCRRGYSCDSETGECVALRKDKCRNVRCPRGEVCHRRTGRCRTRDECAKGCPRGTYCESKRCVSFGKKSCPKCKSGESCSKATGYRCVAGDKPPDPPVIGSISAGVYNATKAGPGARFFLSKGRKHGVKVGARGRLCGKSFTVIAVYATRSQGQTSASLEQVGSCKSAVIKL